MVRFMGRGEEVGNVFFSFMLKSLISIFHVFHLFNSLYQSWSMIYEERDEVVSERSQRRVRKPALDFTYLESCPNTFFTKHKRVHKKSIEKCLNYKMRKKITCL